jgi:hypothetical protein
MTQHSQNETPPADDLTRIKGIGPSRQQWLQDVMNVFTYAELAACTVDDIEEQLKAESRIVSREDIADWISHAAELAAEAAKPEALNPAPAEDERPAALKRGNGWEPAASFVVEFQTRQEEWQTVVHHIETDENQDWPDVAVEQLGDWMAARVPAKGLPESRSALPTTTAEIGISAVEVFQPPDVLLGQFKPGELFPALMAGREAIMFAAVLSAGDSDPALLAGYDVQFQVTNLETWAPSSLGQGTIETAAGMTVRAAMEQPTSLSAGRYRLTVIASHNAHAAPPLYFEVPLLQVL